MHDPAPTTDADPRPICGPWYWSNERDEWRRAARSPDGEVLEYALSVDEDSWEIIHPTKFCVVAAGDLSRFPKDERAAQGKAMADKAAPEWYDVSNPDSFPRPVSSTIAWAQSFVPRATLVPLCPEDLESVRLAAQLSHGLVVPVVCSVCCRVRASNDLLASEGDLCWRDSRGQEECDARGEELAMGEQREQLRKDRDHAEMVRLVREMGIDPAGPGTGVELIREIQAKHDALLAKLWHAGGTWLEFCHLCHVDIVNGECAHKPECPVPAAEARQAAREKAAEPLPCEHMHTGYCQHCTPTT